MTVYGDCLEHTDGTFARRVAGNGYAVRGTLNGSSPGTIAAAGDYSANDILSDSATDTQGHYWVFDDAAAVSGGSGWICKLLATCSVDALTTRLRVWFFKSAPTTTEMDDNAAFNLTAADRGAVVGYLDLPAFADAGAVSYAQNISDRLPFTASGDDKLYAVVQTLDAFTNESAGMTLDLWIWVERY